MTSQRRSSRETWSNPNVAHSGDNDRACRVVSASAPGEGIAASRNFSTNGNGLLRPPHRNGSIDSEVGLVAMRSAAAALAAANMDDMENTDSKVNNIVGVNQPVQETEKSIGVVDSPRRSSRRASRLLLPAQESAGGEALGGNGKGEMVSESAAVNVQGGEPQDDAGATAQAIQVAVDDILLSVEDATQTELSGLKHNPKYQRCSPAMQEKLEAEIHLEAEVVLSNLLWLFKEENGVTRFNLHMENESYAEGEARGKKLTGQVFVSMDNLKRFLNLRREIVDRYNCLHLPPINNQAPNKMAHTPNQTPPSSNRRASMKDGSAENDRLDLLNKPHPDLNFTELRRRLGLSGHPANQAWKEFRRTLRKEITAAKLRDVKKTDEPERLHRETLQLARKMIVVQDRWSKIISYKVREGFAYWLISREYEIWGFQAKKNGFGSDEEDIERPKPVIRDESDAKETPEHTISEEPSNNQITSGLKRRKSAPSLPAVVLSVTSDSEGDIHPYPRRYPQRQNGNNIDEPMSHDNQEVNLDDEDMQLPSQKRRRRLVRSSDKTGLSSPQHLSRGSSPDRLHPQQLTPGLAHTPAPALEPTTTTAAAHEIGQTPAQSAPVLKDPWRTDNEAKASQVLVFSSSPGIPTAPMYTPAPPAMMSASPIRTETSTRPSPYDPLQRTPSAQNSVSGSNRSIGVITNPATTLNMPLSAAKTLALERRREILEIRRLEVLIEEKQVELMEKEAQFEEKYGAPARG